MSLRSCGYLLPGYGSSDHRLQELVEPIFCLFHWRAFVGLEEALKAEHLVFRLSSSVRDGEEAQRPHSPALLP